MKKPLLIAAGFLLCIYFGVQLGNMAAFFYPKLKSYIASLDVTYKTADKSLAEEFETGEITALTWEALLPEKEKQILLQYQQTQSSTVQDFTNQLLQSLEAAHDQSYVDAMQSTNVNDEIADKLVEIAGFIVPLDFHQDNSIQHLFLVPYFGACIHFPPPPPNQIIFARLEPGMNNFSIEQAYRLKGRITLGLFEDPAGTSAYMLEVFEIRTYFGEPDDLRQHDR